MFDHTNVSFSPNHIAITENFTLRVAVVVNGVTSSVEITSEALQDVNSATRSLDMREQFHANANTFLLIAIAMLNNGSELPLRIVADNLNLNT